MRIIILKYALLDNAERDTSSLPFLKWSFIMLLSTFTALARRDTVELLIILNKERGR